MNTAFIRHSDGTVATTDSLVECARALRDEGTRLWLDVCEPDDWDLMLIGEAFDFHPLTIEDCLHGDQRVRIDAYDAYFFLVLYAPALADGDRLVHGRELALFCSARYIVTVHHEASATMTRLLDRCRRDTEGFLGRGTDQLLYQIVDSVVDEYLPILERLETEAGEIEDRALSDPAPEILENLMLLKREVTETRRFLLPMRDVVARFTRGEFSFVGTQMQLYFRDVLDHLLRTLEMIEQYREQLSVARELYLSSISQRLNEIMKVLTVFATIMLPLSLVAGIYGMNFARFWPPGDAWYGFPIVMLMMVALTGGLLYYFRRRGWL
jgi:magnesium transporter